jgi:hypothetical protein
VLANRTDERAIEAIAALRRLRFTGPTRTRAKGHQRISCGFLWIRVDLWAFVFD